MTNIKAKLKFQRRPSPVLAEYRSFYKIGQLILILYLASRGNRSSYSRLHLFNWALKSKQRTERLVLDESTKNLYITAWGFDPALIVAIRLAIASNLIKKIGTNYQLSDDGIVFAKFIVKDEEIFITEKTILKRIGKKITETMVNKVVKEWE